MVEPYELTVSQASDAIAARRLSPLELLESLLGRIELIEPAIEAWVRLDTERAVQDAQQCEAEAAAGRLRGPLHGVPIGFKDIYFTEGLATEAGSPIYRGFIPRHDARTVARLRAAGAIVLGKTETTQFAMGDPAPTRNPWNLEHTPGGSSSGSAAAVAARMVPAALGTQTAGSVLRPAAFCGVVGFKPTYRRYSTEGIVPLARSLDHPGTLTRTVDDARLLFSILDERGEVGTGADGKRPPLILQLSGAFLDSCEPGASQHFRAIMAALSRGGATVQTWEAGDLFEPMLEVHHVIMAAEAAALHAQDFSQRPQAYRPLLRALIEAGSLIPAAAYIRAQELRTALVERLRRRLPPGAVLALPSARGAAPKDLTTTGDPVMNAPWSLCGLPAISIPSGLSADGLPYGLQLVGQANEDAALLDLAAWCEAVLGPLPAPPVI